MGGKLAGGWKVQKSLPGQHQEDEPVRGPAESQRDEGGGVRTWQRRCLAACTKQPRQPEKGKNKLLDLKLSMLNI